MKDTHEVLEGPITITRRGTGFFAIGEDKEDLIIPAEWLGTALPGDTVRVAPAGFIAPPGGRGERRAAGKVVEVTHRARELFVGTLGQTESGQPLLIPDSKRMYTPFRLDELKFPLGHKVVVKFVSWDPASPYPLAEVTQDIGEAGVHETEMRALVLGQGFSPDFPPGVVAEAKELEVTGASLIEKGAEGRKDFRTTTTFTIDPADAKDFDDAISVKKLAGGKTEVGIHIADVSYFVRTGTAIDREARTRATSVYLVDRTIPMLPHVLSTNLCSLNPNEDRLSMSAVFVLDEAGVVESEWFGQTVIHSDKRFTYEEAQGVLNAGTGILFEELALVRDLARKIRARRVANGAIEFDTAEVKVDIDAFGKPTAIRLKERQETNLLIEDFMLLANEAVATHLAKKAKEANLLQGLIFRVHDSPDADRMENLAQFLKVLGYDLKITAGRVTGKELNRLLEQVKGKPEEYLVKTATLRSMSKAIYATKNAGHFGLGFEYYTHFTSPIRRYPDLLVHRLVRHYEHNEKMPMNELAEFDALAAHSSEREVSAAEAERDSVKLKIVEFMASHIGEEFDGVISGVSDRGAYVELNETHAEGMVKIRDLGDDYFVHDEKRYRITGERTKVSYALGDPIRVRLIAARLFEKELDFELASKV